MLQQVVRQNPKNDLFLYLTKKCLCLNLTKLCLSLTSASNNGNSWSKSHSMSEYVITKLHFESLTASVSTESKTV